jgi:hypothetical protein
MQNAKLMEFYFAFCSLIRTFACDDDGEDIRTCSGAARDAG